TAYRNTYETNNDDEVSFAAIYDISDRSNPVLMNTAKQSGGYVSSRQSNGIIYLVSEFDRLMDISRREYDSYIPACDGQTVDAGSIYCPEELSYRGYTVIGSIDFNNPDGYIDSESIMAGSSNMYVSSDAIYFLISTSNIKTYKTLGGTLYGKGMSSLVKFSYDNGNIEYVNTAEVPGNADSQFSFSEYNGYIRLVTTAREYIQYANTDEAGSAVDDEWRYNRSTVYGNTSNGLYIFDKDLNPVGSIDNLAEGETLKSSRFLGDMAYFVTFRQTDPLFTVDLSDPANPVITNELKVTGFSEYLHPYADGKMLGIGYEADPNTGARGYIKLSMFDISDSGDVTEENRLVLDRAYIAGVMYDHRAVMVDAGRGIFGFASNYNMYSDGMWIKEYTLYQLFTYDENEGFKELLACRTDVENQGYYYDLGTSRAVYIDDYLYIYDGENTIYIYNLTDYSFVKKIEF
ncbi:MAG: beta-propeller domain-containing protein, partial [Lachnospiraceae bacterium]